ncbi:uncharacterized protein LOC124633352 isoform X3 [Helicoverpa zea]|uniref:uncharacterized protein LOC124633352 isoform X3 n=1 Tax=Helicoverpa zea TaxID=7113 RepID=UPI001F5A74D6|nr:uncharacterized protein LOC124633352 isoform X3 [Helicoverpa zea]
MSFVDLATLTMHRRNELEARLNIFHEKCDRAVEDIKKLKTKTQGFVLQLNCDPAELKERFLSSMKQLDEYMYLITDFNLAVSKLDEASVDYTPVQDTFAKPLQPLAPLTPYNLMDALSEPAPSTSTACSNNCPPEKPKRVKTPKADQTLIVFSSSSSSEETVSQAKIAVAAKEVQCELGIEMSNFKIEESPVEPLETSNLPAQEVLETDHVYEATIMHIDGAFFWLITENPGELESFIEDMTAFYRANHKDMTLDEVKALACCAYYDDESDCYYRGLFLKLIVDSELAEIFVVDTGELRVVPAECVQPLYTRFCAKPPCARCCYLAGVDLLSYQNKTLMEKQEDFMKEYVGKQCTIEVDDNTSESLGVYVMLPSGEVLNDIIVQQGLALPIDKPQEEQKTEEHIPPPLETDLDITSCPEYEDPVEAVTGYSNRDEADICKHYKGGPEKTCFKGKRCTKKHILKHPDGWTLDQVPVFGKCNTMPLPAPGSWHKVLVTCVAHFDLLYVQFCTEKPDDEIPGFGVVLPPVTLETMSRDMNSPATRIAYKPFTIAPAPGEYVAALYPADNLWYRAQVLSVTRSDQNVEVMYIDYGTRLCVREDQLRCLEPRHMLLPMQAVCCKLAGVKERSPSSTQWASAKQTLSDMVMDCTLDAHIISRGYDEITVELFDKEGYSIAEQLAAIDMVKLTEYSVVDDSHVTTKVIVP